MEEQVWRHRITRKKWVTRGINMGKLVLADPKNPSRIRYIGTLRLILFYELLGYPDNIIE